jgi:hypothetical protein
MAFLARLSHHALFIIKLIGVVLTIFFANLTLQLALATKANPRFICFYNNVALPQDKASQTAQDLLTTSSVSAQLGEGAYRAYGNTFATFPEWYIVYSAREYAAVIQNGWPSSFRYHDATAQFWQTNSCMGKLLTTYQPDEGYELTLKVIGVSFTLENTMRAAHEYTVGKLSETLSGRKSPEDEFAAQVASNYAAFLDQTPFYEFPYFETLRSLWSEYPAPQQPIFRSLERKLYLSSEYFTKANYGALIRSATQSTFAPEVPQTVLVTGPLSPQLATQLAPTLQVIATPSAAMSVYTAPRYQALQPVLEALATAQVPLYSIAGNENIMITILAPARLSEAEITNRVGAPSQLLFLMEKLDNPSINRVGVLVPVTNLGQMLRNIAAAQPEITLEHIYDY